MALKGKSVVINVSTDGGSTYNQVLELNDYTMTFSGDNADSTVFGNDWINRTQTLKDATWDISGFYDPNDSTGQIAIRDALINDTQLDIQVLPDGTNGFEQSVKVSDWEESASVDGLVEVSVTLEGNGAPSQVP